MPKFIKKDIATGAVRSFFLTAAGVDYPATLVGSDEALVVYAWTDAQADSSRFYMPGDELLERPAIFDLEEYSLPADGKSQVTATLMKGTSVRHDGAVQMAAKKQAFVFSSAVPGEFTFEIEPPFPYRHQMVRVVAHAL